MSDQGNLPLVSLFADSDTTNYVSSMELEHRRNTNSIVNVFNNSWTDWTPEVFYTGTTTPLEIITARYTQHGSTVLFNYLQSGGANTGVSVTDAWFSLPVVLYPRTGVDFIPCASIALLEGDYSDPIAYIDTANMDTSSSAGYYCVKFRNLSAITTSAYRIEVSGSYEVR